MVTVVFDRVLLEDKQFDSLSTSTDLTEDTTATTNETTKLLSDKIFDSITKGDSVQFKPTKLNQAALDAFNFIQDLIQMINGESPFWLFSDQQQNLVEIKKTFGLELLELIIEQFADVFHKVRLYNINFFYLILIILIFVARRICISS